MKIKHLSIRNFRGISQLDWFIDRDINCLVGSGDSTKSTILTAIYYVFYPTWGLQLNDADFYNQDVTKFIEITATITDISEETKARFGKYLRGIKDTNIVDEPTPEDEAALSIKLTVNSELEPIWSIYNERVEVDDLRHFSQKDRQVMGVFKLGGVYDSDFSWTKYSTLSRLSDQKEAVRKAIRNLKEQSANFPQELQTVASSVQSAAVKMGVKAISGFQPAIDTVELQDGKGVISLQDGEAPLRMKGSGTKRLIALAIQGELATQGSVITIDEIELGLEPYRLRHLIRQIRESYNNAELSQVFATTHSGVAVVEFNISELVKVNCDQTTGIVTILNLPDDKELQKLVRSHDEAVLGKKTIVCEGDTEYGFCVGLDKYWCLNQKDFFTFNGTVPTISSGRKKSDGIDKAVDNAQKMHNLGYEVSVFIDGDTKPGKITIPDLKAQGVEVFMWPDGECLETIIFKEIDDIAFKTLLEQACFLGDEHTVLNELKKIFPALTKPFIFQDIKVLKITPDIRKKVGDIAKKKSWFKTQEGGKILGYIVARSLPLISGTTLYSQIFAMKEWSKR